MTIPPYLPLARGEGDGRAGSSATVAPPRVVFVGGAEARLAWEPSVPHRLDHVDAVDPTAGLSARDVVVLRWDPAAPTDEVLDQLARRPPAERPHVVVTGDVMEDTLKTLIDRHGVIHVVGTRGPANAIDLAVTVDKLLSNDVFGMERYFGDGADVVRYSCRALGSRAGLFDWLRAFAEPRGVNRRIVDILLVVADEMLTNALYNAPMDERGGRPNAGLARTTKVELVGPSTVDLELRCDGQRLGISTVDPFGSLEPDVVVGSLRRCFERAVPRNGPGGAGLGLYLLLGSLSHVVFNIARGRRTEVIGLLEISGGLRQLRSSGKSFNLFMER